MAISNEEKQRSLFEKVMEPQRVQFQAEELLRSGVSNPINMANYLANSFSPEADLAGIGDVEIGSYYEDLVYIFGIGYIDDSALRLLEYLMDIKRRGLGFFVHPGKDMLSRDWETEHVGSVFIFGFVSHEWGIGGWEGKRDKLDIQKIASDTAFLLANPDVLEANKKRKAAEEMERKRLRDSGKTFRITLPVD